MSSVDIDVGSLIDRSRFSLLQVRIVLLCGLASILDGVDTQSIGIAAPALSKLLALSPASMGPVFSAGLLGALVGALGLGTLADHVGRKKVLVLSTVLFGVFSLLTVYAQSFSFLVVLRFLAGLGLGGAAPCFTALAAEYAPLRLRSIVIGVMWASFPFGGMIGAFGSSYLLGHYGWTSIFYVGGTLPIILAVLLALSVPESIRYLSLREQTAERVENLVEQITGQKAPAGTRYTGQDRTHGHSSVSSLFREGRLRTTLLLWVVFLVAFTILVFIPLWAPTLLVRENGLLPGQALIVVAANNLGAVVGMLLCGWLIARVGPYRLLTTAFVLGTIFTAAVGQMAGHPVLTICSAALSGVFIGTGGVGVIALAAIFYPTLIRSTGLGWGLAMARFGQVCGPLVTSWMLRNQLSADSIFLVLGMIPLVGAVCVLLLWRERQRLRGAVAAETVPALNAIAG